MGHVKLMEFVKHKDSTYMYIFYVRLYNRLG